jgi:hypothetical protein
VREGRGGGIVTASALSLALIHELRLPRILGSSPPPVSHSLVTVSHSKNHSFAVYTQTDISTTMQSISNRSKGYVSQRNRRYAGNSTGS